MAFWDNLLDRFSSRVAANVVDRMAVQPMIEARAYASGFYKPQLKVKPNQFDDNIGVNLAGLLVNRVTSQMLGGGFTWDFEGDTETPQEQYITDVLDANKQEVLFHRAAVSASEAGTGYLMIIPDGQVGEDGSSYPRLQLVDPLLVHVDTLPEDYETVVRYTIEYKFTGADGKERARRRVIEHTGGETDSGTWAIDDYELTPGSSRWTLVNSTPWSYSFPPILHWQNLPAAQDVYGIPDLTQAQIALQDRYNFVSSNVSKLIRYYAHPMRIMKGQRYEVIDAGPDKMLSIGIDSDVIQLDALGDLSASMAYLTQLRQAFFACGRVVDIDSISDRLGTLTNFGLKVLYADNLALIATKRELFGDMLEELAQRLQVLAGMQPIHAEVVWPDFLPVNETEQMQAIQTKIDLGLMSKQTAADALGLDWEQESERFDDERQSSDNIGAALMRAFDRGEPNRQPSQFAQRQQPQEMTNAEQRPA